MRFKDLIRHGAVAFWALLMSLAFVLTAYAANGQITFSDPQAQSGSQVNVTLKISADEGTRLADATVTVHYPQDRLEFVSGTDASGGAGTVRIHGVTNGGGSNVLEYNLVFNTSSAGTYDITVDTYEVYDEDGAALNVTHVGSSAVTVMSQEGMSQNADLSTLEVSPGELSPAFDPAVTQYSTTVGASVELLGINALASDPQASVIIRDNEQLQMGSNTVTVSVTAPDGVTIKDYVIQVEKVEGGPEAPVTDAEAEAPDTVEGVQLTARGKTITIMNPGEEVAVPEGFTEAVITIDGQRVKGWFWGADTEPEYCVVYGMNDQGELNFYRYDMKEKTIQRYFSDPMSADAVSNAEYAALQQSYNDLMSSYQMRFIIICILSAIALVLLIAIIVLGQRLRTAERDRQRARAYERRREVHTAAAEPIERIEPDILSHDYDMEPEETVEDMDETRVIIGLGGRSSEASEAADTDGLEEGTADDASEISEAIDGDDIIKDKADDQEEDKEKSDRKENDDTFESFDI